MSVQELRQLLFEVDNQDAEVVIVTAAQYGEVINTMPVLVVGRTDDPADFITLS